MIALIDVHIYICACSSYLDTRFRFKTVISRSLPSFNSTHGGTRGGGDMRFSQKHLVYFYVELKAGVTQLAKLRSWVTIYKVLLIKDCVGYTGPRLICVREGGQDVLLRTGFDTKCRRTK